MNPLKALLAAEFAALIRETSQDPEKFATQRLQAKFLGESASAYNRALQSGRVSPATAHEWADRLTAGRKRSPAELEREILTAAHELGLASHPSTPRISTDVESSVQAAFERLRVAADLARQNPSEIRYPLLMIAYHDRPRALKHRSRYPQLLRPAGRALSAGLRLALFQPFAEVAAHQSGPREPLVVRDYKRKVRVEVRGVAEQIREAALAYRAEQSIVDAPPPQIQLYEAQAAAPGLSMISTRVFFAEYQTGEKLKREVWEWVAGVDSDVFLERDPDSLEWEAFALQFFPVYVYWREYGALPNADALAEVLRGALGQRELDAAFGPQEWPWSVWSGLNTAEPRESRRRAKASP